MSLHKQVKALFLMSLSTFAYILWVIISDLLFSSKEENGYLLYFTILVNLLLMQYLYDKGYKGIGKIIGLAILDGSIFCVFYTFVLAATNLICLLFLLIIVHMMAEENITYESYLSRARKALTFLLLAGFILPWVDGILLKTVFKFYIIFLVIIIITLREVRRYSYKIDRKNDLLLNCGMIGFIMILSSERVFSIVLLLLKKACVVVNFILDKAIVPITYVIFTPMMYLVNIIRNLAAKRQGDLDNALAESAAKNTINKYKIIENQGFVISQNILLLLKIAILLSIILFVYKHINKSRFSIRKEDQLLEEREKIGHNRRSSKEVLSNFLQMILEENNFRKQICAVFKKFEKSTFQIGIFKRYMTATQLENVTKSKFESHEALAKIRSIYNEAKFSKHDMSKEDVKIIKEEYRKIKERLS